MPDPEAVPFNPPRVVFVRRNRFYCAICDKVGIAFRNPDTDDADLRCNADHPVVPACGDEPC